MKFFPHAPYSRSAAHAEPSRSPLVFKLPGWSLAGLSGCLLLGVAGAAFAQEALTLERQPAESSVVRNLRTVPFAGDAPSFHPAAQTPEEITLPQPKVSIGERPTFLPAPTVEESPRAAAPAPTQPAPQTIPRQAAPQPAPATVMAQIELPVPPQTAEPLGIAGTSPQREAIPQAPPQRNADFQSPRDNLAALREDEVPASGAPTIFYDKGQQAVPERPHPVEAPPIDVGLLLKQHRYSEVEPLAIQSSDSKLASAIGWAHFQGGEYDLAYGWFERAIQWNDTNYEAAYGMALVLFKQGKFAEAEEVARWRQGEYPKMKKILGDITASRSVSSFRGKQYKKSREELLSVRNYRSLTREEEIMLGWNTFNLGNIDQARVIFERLYREKPDRYSAEGVYASYAKAQDWAGLERAAKSRGGALEGLYQGYVAEKSFNQGLYRQAYAESPEKFPKLENIASPSVSGGGTGRFRSGTGGTSELSEFRANVAGTLYIKGLDRVDVIVGSTDLDSGSLGAETLIGKAPFGSSTGYRYGAKTSYSGLVDAQIRYEHQGETSPHAEIGITPSGADVEPTLVGSVGLTKHYDAGSVNVELFRDPVKDSVLSYVGLRDPFTGQTWGRVTETGARASLYSLRSDDWGFYGAASFGLRTGVNVPDNQHFAIATALNKSIPQPGFESLTVGPSLAMEYNSKNLSEFTFGHGGYFSPRFLVQGMVAARFLTTQGENYLVRGSAGVGIQSTHQDQADLLPYTPDGRTYDKKSNMGAAILFDMEGIYQLSDQWTIGGGIAYNKAPDYTDFSIRLTLQYFFEPRKGLYVQDFLTF